MELAYPGQRGLLSLTQIPFSSSRYVGTPDECHRLRPKTDPYHQCNTSSSENPKNSCDQHFIWRGKSSNSTQFADHSTNFVYQMVSSWAYSVVCRSRGIPHQALVIIQMIFVQSIYLFIHVALPCAFTNLKVSEREYNSMMAIELGCIF